jgi:hypothetical protein
MSILRNPPRLRLVLAPALVLVVALGLSSSAQPPDAKKLPELKTPSKEPTLVKLPDGTYQWLGLVTGSSDERITLTPQDLQKLQDQIDQLKKQLATRKPQAPSSCAIRGRIQKRGEQPVAILKLTCNFRTTVPQTAILLGGRKGFLVKASLGNNRLPVIETSEDGFVALIETPGDHTLTVEFETPVTPRGAKPELGFELGLPRAAITTLVFDPPTPDVLRVNLTTRTPDPTQPLRPPEVRRVPGLEVRQLAATPPHEAGYPLGPVDSLELTWDQPATTVQSADPIQSAELTINVLLTEGVVETTAKIALRGTAREWKLVAPPTADLSVERVPNPTDTGPTLPPAVSKPTDASKPVWTIEFPTGGAAADWVVTVVTRQPRPKPEDPAHRGPFPIGPLAVLNVLRQTGTVRVTTVANTRLVFKHGPDLRRDVPPGALEEDVTTAFFRLTTGPTGTTPLVNPLPLLTVQAIPLTGTLRVKPVYSLTHTDTAWRIRAEVRITPVHTEVDVVTIEIPTEWRGLEASPPELVEGIQPGLAGGFWQTAPQRLAGGHRAPVVVRLAAGHKQPFDLVLTATVPFAPGASEVRIPFPRFPGAYEPEAIVTATIGEGREIRGELFGWDGDFIVTPGIPLMPLATPSETAAQSGMTVSGKSDIGLARVALSWNLQRLNITAEVRADVTVQDRQVLVNQVIRFRSADGFLRGVRLRGPNAAGLKSQPLLDTLGAGEWILPPQTEAREITLSLSYAIPSGRQPDDHTPWQIPIGLIWPVGIQRTEATARIWTNTLVPRSLINLAPAWRELPVEVVPDRGTLPALVLGATGSEVPLVVEAREVGVPTGVSVWIDRAVIQTWATDNGTTSYRVRWLLRRWLSSTLEVQLPEQSAGATPEFFRDDVKVEPVLFTEPGTYRIPLPEPQPDRMTLVEVRYQLSAQRSRFGELTCLPPDLPTAAFIGPVRWQVTVAPGVVPLFMGGGSPEVIWRIQNGRLVAGTTSLEELERWLRAGGDRSSEDPGSPSGESITAYQTAPRALTVYRVPQLGLIVTASVLACVLILALSRLPAGVVGLVLAVLGGTIALAAVLFAQPTAQIAIAAQAGLAAALVVLLIQVGVSWLYRRRVTYLPGFARGRPLPSAPSVPSSARNRAAVLGTGGTTPVPAGGS